tara:strand:+ start:1187 stop:2353 length:1167 start_codon:yes stop_codon:yes gene_type:complete
MKKKIAILGSTGSIGSETINLIKKDKKNFDVILLSTNTNIYKIYKQAKFFNVKNIIINDSNSFKKAKKLYKNSSIKFHNSFSIIDKLFKKKEIFYSMISVVGLDGLDPSLRLIKYTQNIAIINKESLICGWNLINQQLQKYKTNFFPIDSEHFSIFSLLNGANINDVDKVYITASGGPFLNYNYNKLSKITVNQALKHPNWIMGKKISIDSSTMMNKLFEVIEAKKIFDLSYDKIKILIHPKSYVHAIVEFKNGLSKILIHEPEMKIPIHNSIYFKNDKKLKSKKINFKILNQLNFQSVNYKKFPLVKLLNILPNHHSLFETVLVTINDYFVSAYLKKKINYKQLIKLIKKYSHLIKFTKFKKNTPKSINDIYKTRKYVNEILSNSGI